MKKKYTSKVILHVFAVLIVIIMVQRVIVYRSEEAFLSACVKNITSHIATNDPEKIILAIRDYLRAHVSYKEVDLSKRGFLRSSAAEVIATGKGYCGENTRAFIGLLRQCDIPARRIYLDGVRYEHVTPEVYLHDRWVIVDGQDRSFDNHPEGGYYTVQEVIDQKLNRWFEYSTFNLKRFGLWIVPGMPYYVHGRLPGAVSWFLESPRLIECAALGIGEGIVCVFLVMLRQKKKL